MERMILHWKGTAANDTQLLQLIAQENDATSPLYHRDLTPDKFQSIFWAHTADITKIRSWLQSHGFCGSASHVAAAFKTEIRS